MGRSAIIHLRWLAFFTALLLACLAGFNMFMNPYGHFGTPRIGGINELTLGFNHRAALTKSLAISRIRPATIILGNSRAETAYDPQHPGFDAQPAYNLSLGGAGLQEMKRYFLEALAQGRLRHVLLALDLTMFDPQLPGTEIIPDNVLLTDETGKSRGSIRAWQRSGSILLSGTATSDSLWSLTHQRKPVALYSASGQRDESADNDQVAREGGHLQASINTESTFLASSLRNLSAQDFTNYAIAMAQLQEIVSIAMKQDIRLTLIINPIHARQTYLLSAANLWPAYEKWKKDLAAMPARTSQPGQFALWDFSGISPCTAEPMPRAEGAVMRWYRESSHFQRVLGDQVLDIALREDESGPCRQLAQRLDKASIEAVLAEQRGALNKWKARNPVDATEIDDMAKRFGRQGSVPSPTASPFRAPTRTSAAT